MHFKRSVVFPILLVGILPCSLGAQSIRPLSDFGDDTLQGWSLLEGQNAVLTVPATGGRPGGFLRAEDTGRAGILVVAPDEFTGDLSPFSGMLWDQFLFTGNPAPTISTFIQLVGSDGTTYQSHRDVTTIDRWITRFASLQSSRDWALVESTGEALFSDVVSNVQMLAVSMETSPRAGVESGIDNIQLVPGTAHSQLMGPSDYLCFDAGATRASGDCNNKDSPFKNVPFVNFYLDNFEDKAINTRGVTATASCPGYPAELGCPFSSIRGFAPTGTDSVDEDDGAIDGSGQTTSRDRGHAMWSATPIEFTFDADALGGLPTHAGIVWTDGGATGTLEAFDAAGESIETIAGVANDGVFTGTTIDDRFFGAIHLAGISKIKFGTGFAIEVDHLQYGSAVAVSAAVNAATFVHDPASRWIGVVIRLVPERTRSSGTEHSTS